MMLPREDVVLVPSREESPKENLQNLKRLKLMSASTRLDVRGMRAEEAIEKLEKFIDDACLAELPRVEILHGKGSGALMRAVREYLKGHGCVKSFRLGEQQEGSWGVTVAFFQ
jgi:DNA mismatch repair protein MutS2